MDSVFVKGNGIIARVHLDLFALPSSQAALLSPALFFPALGHLTKSLLLCLFRLHPPLEQTGFDPHRVFSSWKIIDVLRARNGVILSNSIALYLNRYIRLNIRHINEVSRAAS